MARADHPAGRNHRGPNVTECQSFRRVIAPLVVGKGATGTDQHEFKVDCSLDRGHIGLHTDPSGRRWEAI
jgi:hypothetical protein